VPVSGLVAGGLGVAAEEEHRAGDEQDGGVAAEHGELAPGGEQVLAGQRLGARHGDGDAAAGQSPFRVLVPGAGQGAGELGQQEDQPEGRGDRAGGVPQERGFPTAAAWWWSC